MSFPDESSGLYENGYNRPNTDNGYGVHRAFKHGGLKAGASRTVAVAYRVLSRRKTAEEGTARLARVLSTFDLTALGVGSTLGSGVYVLLGSIAKQAGPAVIISILIAAVASIFAGLCYAEFGARVPKAGSAYVYSYVCVGELIAFFIGWNLIVEYMLGAASVTKALIEHVDAFANHTISAHQKAWFPALNSPHLAEYPDVFAFVIIMLFSVALALGVKESSKFNNFCTAVNMLVVGFVIVSSFFKGDTSNWRIPPSEVPAGGGAGGFAPYGYTGVIKGATTCFYLFIGFDCVATSGEEAKRPQKSIPFAIVASLLIVLLTYSAVASVLTLIIPYYDQDNKIPLPHMYARVGWVWAQYTVGAGAVCALCASIMGSVYPLPRIIYSMSSDGLLFRSLGAVSARFQTPLVGTVVAGFFTGLLVMVFRLDQLTNMMSIGTLFAYSMVAACVMLLRYERSTHAHKPVEPMNFSLRNAARQLVNADRHAAPTRLSSVMVSVLVTLYGIWCLVAMSCVKSLELAGSSAGLLATLAVFTLLALGTLYCVSRQPVSEKKLAFSVPLVPWLPGLSILINVYLMLEFKADIWARFAGWIGAGLIIYFTYGVWHSSERRRTLEAVALADLHTDSQTALLNRGLQST